MKGSKRAAPLPPATISEIDGVRYLHLGTPWVQGSMRIGKPLAIELEYVQRMMAWLLLRAARDRSRAATRCSSASARRDHALLRARC